MARPQDHDTTELVRALLAGSPHAAYLVDLTGVVVAANRRGAERLGVTEQELVGTSIANYFPPDVAEARRQRGIEAMLSGQEVTFEDNIGDRWYLSTIAPLRDEQGQPSHLAIYGVDITQRRRAEELLRIQRDLAVSLSGTRELAETLRLCLEAAMQLAGMDCGGIYLLDPAADAFDLVHHHGLPPEFIANASHYPADSPNARLVKAGRPIYTRYCELVAYDDPTLREGLRALAVLPISHEGTVIGCLNLASHAVDEVPELSRAAVETTATRIGVAITRARAEQDLRRSEATYRTLFEEASDGIVLVDIESGTIVDCNRAAQEMVGRARAELVGSPLGTLHPPEVTTPFERLLGATLGQVIETLVLTSTGEHRAVAVKASRVTLGDRAVVQALYRDITDAKRLEAQLRQAQKLEAIGTLAGGIAHDFNNLLMGIQGNASLLQLELEPPHHERLRSIEECVRSGTELTAQLLGFARGGRYEIRTIDLNALVQRTSRMFGRTRKQVAIHRKLQDDLWTVEADQGQLEQVLVNLLVNAWQAMPDGGELFVETSNLTLERGYVRAHDVPAGRYVQVSVTDTGVGMDEATRQRIFEPFFTTKEMGRGTGLGLATVYGIVKSHGGFLSVYSEQGEGTTFNIYLPASDRPVTAARPRPDAVAVGTETILLVDDEETVLVVSGKMLEKLGYQVLIARSGNEALEQYRQHRDRVAMVILDLIMPGGGGGEIYDRLREVNPGVRVLLSSGYSLNGEARAIVERGCRGFIQKPFNLKDLSQRVREVLDGG
jgi:PAS domain S-box-containing protein